MDTLGYAEFSRVVEEHDKQIIADTVDECIEILKAYPTVTAMGEIKKLKEQENEQNNLKL